MRRIFCRGAVSDTVLAARATRAPSTARSRSGAGRPGTRSSDSSRRSAISACAQLEITGYRRGLLRYTTENALAAGDGAAAIWKRVLRPRTALYSAVLLTIIAVAIASLAMRKPLSGSPVLRREGLEHPSQHTADVKRSNARCGSSGRDSTCEARAKPCIRPASWRSGRSACFLRRWRCSCSGRSSSRLRLESAAGRLAHSRGPAHRVANSSPFPLTERG